MLVQRGFTLIELLVTIAVLVILATAAAPSFLNMITQQRLNDSTSALVTTLGQARNQAVSLRSSVAVCLGTTTTTTQTLSQIQAQQQTDQTNCSSAVSSVTPVPASVVVVPMANGVSGSMTTAGSATKAVMFSSAGVVNAFSSSGVANPGATTVNLVAGSNQTNVCIEKLGSAIILNAGESCS